MGGPGNNELVLPGAVGGRGFACWGGGGGVTLGDRRGGILELEGEWVGVGRDFVGWVVASSCEKVLGVVVWLLVGY